MSIILVIIYVVWISHSPHFLSLFFFFRYLLMIYSVLSKNWKKEEEKKVCMVTKNKRGWGESNNNGNRESCIYSCHGNTADLVLKLKTRFIYPRTHQSIPVRVTGQQCPVVPWKWNYQLYDIRSRLYIYIYYKMTTTPFNVLSLS